MTLRTRWPIDNNPHSGCFPSKCPGYTKSLQSLGSVRTKHHSTGNDWKADDCGGSLEELLIYGLPFFLLRNNMIRSIWWWTFGRG
ncbi:unnamed protein product, partial [Mesorhabditis belari]|uniref:Uncharacterized protein n=1 Tax=Mesorhabditis belari TaxID=2138241 RepID=A0AAF3EBR9_9BILA